MMISGLVVALIVAIAACGGSSSSASKTIRVVAAENMWGDIAAQIGGADVQVTSIISDPNTDPHEYEASTRNAASIARANLVIENGLGYDDFMAKLLSAASVGQGKVLHVDQIMGISGDDANPHLWYDTAELPKVASAIADRLAALDKAHASQFRANADSFVASLQPITDVINQISSTHKGESIAYTERVAGYLVTAAGLKLGIPASFAQAIEDGNEPSASDTAAFDDAITSHSVKVLLYNSQVTDSTTDKIKSLAVQNHVPVVGVSETLPSSDHDFQAWQLRQARALLAALGG